MCKFGGDVACVPFGTQIVADPKLSIFISCKRDVRKEKIKLRFVNEMRKDIHNLVPQLCEALQILPIQQ